jgi:YopT peptidase
MSGSVLPNAKLIDANLKMGTWHNAIIGKAIEYGGACTKKFDQGDASLTKGVGSVYGPHGWNGVCFALSLMWIAFHAKDEDFWGWLYGQDTISRTPYGSIASNRATMIVGLQGALYNRSFTADLKSANARGLSSQGLAEYWLRSDGIVKISYGNVPVTKIQKVAANLATQLAPDSYKVGGCYKELGMFSPNGGHSCAAWVGSDVTYFDPNFGEFWFEKAAQFRKWFAYYWFSSQYFDVYSTYEITAYSPLASGRR